MLAAVRRPAELRGEIRLPGDKSISHRALILNAVAGGAARVEGLSTGTDIDSTAACLRALGVEIEPGTVRGVGLAGLRQASGPLDCGNSGTTMRLLAGLLAAQPFPSELIGDASLSSRPMERVVSPLRRMGAAASWPPLRVGGTVPLRGHAHRCPVASAQVKSALLLAGLRAEGETSVTEPAQTRNHTEVMLAGMGARVRDEGLTVTVSPVGRLRPLDITVPGDLSAAAFWLVLAGLHPRASLRLPGVGVNPTRSAVLGVLARCGVPVRTGPVHLEGQEPVAGIDIGTGRAEAALEIESALAARVIDELPVLAVLAALLPGRSRITGATELRVKESDRIAALAAGLAAMGARIAELEDGWEIVGPVRLEGARVLSRGDHRVAMALAVAGALAEGTTEIEGAECVAISYPGFWDDLARVGALC
ncbi:MAG: 3-phosphoshikimate 1-carboxyvinyltransferase [Candidatus Dormibacteraceae bacterium]